MTDSPTSSTRPSGDDLPALLLPVLQDQLQKTVTIEDWRPATQGFSTESYLFNTVDVDGQIERLVLRRPPEAPLFPDYDLLRQVRVMDKLQDSTLSVPRVRWLDRSSNDLGTPYFVMEHIDSAGTASDFPSYHEAGIYLEATPDQRAEMWWSCIDTIAEVHQLDWPSMDLGFLAYPEHGDNPLVQVVNYLHDAIVWASDGQPRPELQRGLQWLKDNVYEPEHLVLCWGDSRLSNILYGDEFDVRGVLDWEIAYLGDHEADLAWLLFLDWASTEHAGVAPLVGTPTRAEAIERYEQATGWTVQNLRYNEVLAAVILSCPLLRVGAKLRSDGLIDDTMDFSEFCSVRIEQLLFEG